MRTKRCARALRMLGLAAGALLAGCGGGADATEQQLSALRAEIVKMRADSAVLSERLDALERSRSGRADAQQRASARSLPPDRPTLEVVRLGPEPRDDAGVPGLTMDPPAEPDEPPAVLRSTRGGEVVIEAPKAASKQRPITQPQRRTP